MPKKRAKSVSIPKQAVQAEIQPEAIPLPFADQAIGNLEPSEQAKASLVEDKQYAPNWSKAQVYEISLMPDGSLEPAWFVPVQETVIKSRIIETEDSPKEDYRGIVRRNNTH